MEKNKFISTFHGKLEWQTRFWQFCEQCHNQAQQSHCAVGFVQQFCPHAVPACGFQQGKDNTPPIWLSPREAQILSYCTKD